jgi:hypothetical protein
LISRGIAKQSDDLWITLLKASRPWAAEPEKSRAWLDNAQILRDGMSLKIKDLHALADL